MICTDPLSEKRGSSVYVPRDEEFAEVKSLSFSAKTVYSVIHAVIPSIENVSIDAELGFPYFTAIDTLFNEGIDLPEVPKSTLINLLPRLLKTVTDQGKNLILFETPEFLDRKIKNVTYLSFNLLKWTMQFYLYLVRCLIPYFLLYTN